MSKIININPALFSFSGGGGTRKKQPKTDLKIKVKSSMIKENNKTTKRALLKYIRNQQEKNYEKSMKSEKHENKQPVVPVVPNPSSRDTFNTDFDESVKYLTEIAEQNAKNIIPVNHMNRTLRNVSSILPNPYTMVSTANNFLPIMDNLPSSLDLNSIVSNYNELMPAKMNYPMPQHGCLKRGLLPTYRTWKNQTQKNTMHIGGGANPPIHIKQPQIQMHPQLQTPNLVGGNLVGGNKPKPNPSPIMNQMREAELDKKLKNMSEITQLSNKLKINKKQGIHYPKQKRILRRTYTVGKSKVFPKISVLVSNKTIRNNISTKTQLLKQVPMNDVKKYLIKHGFIRVGTVAPNDVLRKMYESAILICGNINNHNPDNLLYNYFNDNDHDK